MKICCGAVVLALAVCQCFLPSSLLIPLGQLFCLVEQFFFQKLLFPVVLGLDAPRFTYFDVYSLHHLSISHLLE